MWQYLLLVGAVLVRMPRPPVGSSRHYEAEAYAHKKDVCGANELVWLAGSFIRDHRLRRHSTLL